MSRSLKKGPYVDTKLMKKISMLIDSGEKKIIKTWARSSMIPPEFVGFTIAVHNGNRFIPVYITEYWISLGAKASWKQRHYFSSSIPDPSGQF